MTLNVEDVIAKLEEMGTEQTKNTLLRHGATACIRRQRGQGCSRPTK